MKTASLTQDIQYNEGRPNIKVLLETESGKEIRISFKEGQIMKRHQTPFPIVVEIFEGEIDFGVQESKQHLVKGDLISLGGKIPHDLTAIKDSIVRLSLNKADSADRVKRVAKKPQ